MVNASCRPSASRIPRRPPAASVRGGRARGPRRLARARLRRLSYLRSRPSAEAAEARDALEVDDDIRGDRGFMMSAARANFAAVPYVAENRKSKMDFQNLVFRLACEDALKLSSLDTEHRRPWKRRSSSARREEDGLHPPPPPPFRAAASKTPLASHCCPLWLKSGPPGGPFAQRPEALRRSSRDPRSPGGGGRRDGGSRGEEPAARGRVRAAQRAARDCRRLRTSSWRRTSSRSRTWSARRSTRPRRTWHFALGTWPRRRDSRSDPLPWSRRGRSPMQRAEEVAHRPLLIIGLTPSPESQGFARAPRRTRAFVAL